MFFEPARDGVRVTPLVFGFSVDFGDFSRAQIFFDILFLEPFFILIEGFGS